VVASGGGAHGLGPRAALAAGQPRAAAWSGTAGTPTPTPAPGGRSAAEEAAGPA
jgi:hypothetical protein